MGTCERVRVLSVAVGGFDDGVGQSLSCWRNDILVADGELLDQTSPGCSPSPTWEMGTGTSHPPSQSSGSVQSKRKSGLPGSSD
jgi:hypothetical protein